MSSPDPPDPPDYAAANREAIYADVETLPLRKKIEAAARMGGRVEYTDEAGVQQVADFEGFGDLDQTRQQLDFIGESARQLAETQLSVQEEFGDQFIAQRLKELETSDPLGFEVRKRLGQEALKDLDAGYGLDDGLRNEITQSVRGAQAARGNILGNAPGSAEAFAIGDAAVRLRQQRLANASSFLSGVTPVAQFGSISGAQNGAAAFNPVGIQQGIGQNANAGQIGTNFALSNYQQESQNAISSAQLNPLNTFMGALGGVAFSGLTGGIGGAIGADTTFRSGFASALGGRRNQ